MALYITFKIYYTMVLLICCTISHVAFIPDTDSADSDDDDDSIIAYPLHTDHQQCEPTKIEKMVYSWCVYGCHVYRTSI